MVCPSPDNGFAGRFGRCGFALLAGQPMEEQDFGSAHSVNDMHTSMPAALAFAPSGGAKAGSVFVLDGDPYAAAALRSSVAALGYACAVFSSVDDLLATVRSAGGGVLVADLGGRDRDLVALLQSVQAAAPGVAVIASGADINAARAIEWIRAGAADVLVKPFSGAELSQAIERAVSRTALSRPTAVPAAGSNSRGPLEEVVGSDPRLARALELARAASRVRSTVLIHGESGTGKSLLARAIHRASPRAEMPFVELACGSIPETLLESELFGHVKGAFTGAIADKKGRFLAADGGTLFLDEINSASPTMQLKLLRVLQERKFEAVGSDQTIEVDVRVIVASNQPLERLVEEGRFRQDLFYRVHVLPIELPPLRERPNDVVTLAEHFLRAKSAELGRTILGFTAAAGDAMRRYRWPGNVRELENAIERAAIMCDAAWLDDVHLPERVRSAEAAFQSPMQPAMPPAAGASPAPAAQPWTPMREDRPGGEPRVIPIAGGSGREPQSSKTLADTMRDPERSALLAALAAHNWNRSKAAASLGINRTTLYRKMRDLGLNHLGEAG